MKKKNLLFITFLIPLLIQVSCKNKQPEIIYNTEIPLADINDKEWDFSRFYTTGCIDHPVVHLKIGKSTYYFLVDTGSPSNLFWGIPDDSMEINEGGNVKTYGTNIKIDNNFVRICFSDKWSKELKKYFKPNVIDGIIGEDFLQNYNNVVFDFNNGKICFAGESISDDSTPLLSLSPYYPCIEFTASGKTEYGMIDTGSSFFSIRENFGDGNSYFNSKELYDSAHGKEKLKKSFRNNPIIKDIKIVNQKYKETLAFEWDSNYIRQLEEVLPLARKLSILGNPFWNGHVIQLDFYNNVFRIK